MRDLHTLPVIQRDYGERDRNLAVLSTPYDSVSFVRGLGDSGYRLEVVAMTCPYCEGSTERMLREWRVLPDEPDTAKYYCLNPSCPYFVRGKFSHIRGRRPKKIHQQE